MSQGHLSKRIPELRGLLPLLSAVRGELDNKTLLLKTPHALDTGHEEINGGDQETPSLLVSFHTDGRGYVGCWGGRE